MASKIYPSVRPKDGSSRLNANEIAMANKSPSQVFKSGIIRDIKDLEKLGTSSGYKAAQDLYNRHFKD